MLQKIQPINDLDEMNIELDFILKNGNAEQKLELFKLLFVIKNKITKQVNIYEGLDEKISLNFLKENIKHHLNFILKNGNMDNIQEAEDWIFIIKNETEDNNFSNIIQFPLNIEDREFNS